MTSSGKLGPSFSGSSSSRLKYQKSCASATAPLPAGNPGSFRHVQQGQLPTDI